MVFTLIPVSLTLKTSVAALNLSRIIEIVLTEFFLREAVSSRRFFFQQVF